EGLQNVLNALLDVKGVTQVRRK
ncbi:MAG: hypothetical protein RIS03_441, partial [Pseudomonadota bacterium]